MKTISLKKVSAVAVAALAFGGLTSVAPANAVLTGFSATNKSSSSYNVTTVGNLTQTNGTAAWTMSAALAQTDVGKAVYTAANGYVGTIATVAANGLTGTFTAVTVIGADLATVAAFTGTLASTTVANGITAGQINGMTVAAGASIAIAFSLTGAPATTQKVRVRYSTAGTAGTSAAVGAVTVTGSIVNFTAPTTVGTYSLILENSILGTFLTSFPAGDAELASQTFTLTVVAATAYNAGASTAFANDLVVVGDATTDGTIYGPSTLDTQAGNITVTVRKADGTACTTCAVGAYMIGQGNVSAGATVANATGAAKARTVATPATPAADGTANIAVWGDGTAGTGTVYVRVTDIDGLTITTLATKSVVFYGAVTKLEVSKQPYSILKAGGATSGIKTALVSAATTTILTSPAIVIKATDSAGNAVGGLTLSCVPTDTSVVASCGNNEDVVTTIDPNSTWGGPGYYVFDMTSAQSAASKAKSTVTYRVINPAAPTTYLTVTADFTIGGTVSKETITFDKTAYAPGEAMVVTRTAVDSAGNPVFDGAVSPAINFSKSVGGSVGTSNYVGGKKASSLTSPSVWAPSIGGTFTATATSGNTAGDTITAASSVTDANAGLMTQIDALNAKIVALNALIAKIMKKLGVK